MSGWYITGHERRRPPQIYQDFITRIGGKNRFGEPNFILAWGGTRTQRIYSVDANGRRGQHLILEFGGVPAWHVLEWKPPECFGTPQMWYTLTWDPEQNCHTLGEYPRRGLYIPCSFNLYVKQVIGGGTRYDSKTGEVVELPSTLKIDALPLNFYILEMLVPNVRKAAELTHQQKVLAIRMQKEAEQRAAAAKAYDAYLDAAPAFGGVAGTYESNREALEQRLKEKAAGMRLRAQDVARYLGRRGHTQVNSGKIRRH
jgi:hypothetical protein